MSHESGIQKTPLSLLDDVRACQVQPDPSRTELAPGKKGPPSRRRAVPRTDGRRNAESWSSHPPGRLPYGFPGSGRRPSPPTDSHEARRRLLSLTNAVCESPTGRLSVPKATPEDGQRVSRRERRREKDMARKALNAPRGRGPETPRPRRARARRSRTLPGPGNRRRRASPRARSGASP